MSSGNGSEKGAGKSASFSLEHRCETCPFWREKKPGRHHVEGVRVGDCLESPAGVVIVAQGVAGNVADARGAMAAMPIPLTFLPEKVSHDGCARHPEYQVTREFALGRARVEGENAALYYLPKEGRMSRTPTAEEFIAIARELGFDPEATKPG